MLAEFTHNGWCVELYDGWRPRVARVAAVLPDIRNYPSYLRAVPLIAEEDLEVAKVFPLIDLEKTRENVRYALEAPYVFLPIPPKRSPFPAVRKYKTGDKFRVNYGSRCFLIETFANGSIAEDSGKRN